MWHERTPAWPGILGWAILWTLTAGSAAAVDTLEELSGEVVDVVYGDLIEVMQDGKAVEIRLDGIDAPEQGQAFANISRDGLAHAVFGKVVDVWIVGRDVDKCLLGRVYLGDVDINLELVKAGLAWHYRRRSSDEALSAAQKAARKAQRGLWQKGPRPVPPWEFRQAREESERIRERETDQLGYVVKPGGGPH